MAQADKAKQPPPAPPHIPTADEVLAQMPTKQLLLHTVSRLYDELASARTDMAERHAGYETLAFRLLGTVPTSNGNGATHVNGVHKQKKLRVAVVGLLNDQRNHVEKAVGHKLDLRFLSSETAKPNFPDADKVVLMVNFIDHHWFHAARTQFDSTRVIMHNGGITGLVEVLEGL